MKVTKKQAIGGVVVATMLVGGVLALPKGEKPEYTNDKFILDYGNSIPTDANYYLNNSEGVKVVFSADNEKGKEFPAVGKYKIEFTGSVKGSTTLTIEDKQPPKIKGTNYTVPLNTKFTDQQLMDFFTVTDLAKTVLEISHKYNGEKEGDYVVTAVATDASGNKTEFSITITVSKEATEVTSGEEGILSETEAQKDETEKEDATSKPNEDNSTGSTAGSSSNKPEVSQPNTDNSTSNKPSTTKPSTTKPKPEVSKPDVSKPDTTKPEPSKPEKFWWEDATDEEIREKVTNSLVWKNERTGAIYRGFDGLEYGWAIYEYFPDIGLDGYDPETGTIDVGYSGLALVENPYNILLGQMFPPNSVTNVNPQTNDIECRVIFDNYKTGASKSVYIQHFNIKPSSVRISYEELHKIYGVEYPN